MSFIFYDFETQQHEHLPGDNLTRAHKPNLCIAQRVFTACLDNEKIEEEYFVCEKRELILNVNPVAQLVKLALASSKKILKIVCIAHDARGFDAQFILRYLVETAKTHHEWNENYYDESYSRCFSQ